MTVQTRRYPTEADFERLFQEDRPTVKLLKILKRLTTSGRPSLMTAGVHYAACWHHLVSKSR